MNRRVFLVAAILATSCKEFPEPFVVESSFPKPDPEGTRLTYNPGDDRSPAWSSNSDSIFYTASSYDPFPVTNGMLVAAPRDGGVVKPLLPTVQRGPYVVKWLSAPVASQDGQSIAYYEVGPKSNLGCNYIAEAQTGLPLDFSIAESLGSIQSAALEVRTLAGEQPRLARHDISLDSVTLDTSRKPAGLNHVTVIDVHPHREYYQRIGPAFLRAAWSPDGTRVVFTDGLDLYMWTVGSGSPVIIPNTHDAVWPAWSPDGQWIAFTRLSRVPSNASGEYYCHLITEKSIILVAYLDLTAYQPTVPTIERVRVDGSAGSVIGPGEAPTWASNGTEIVFVRDKKLWRSNADGSDAREIPNTVNAHEPTVSPDGKWLAFIKHNASLKTNDVWVAAF